ncbi:MAG: hypothetical protein ACJ77B_04180 [Chloroflexota bacterium]
MSAPQDAGTRVDLIFTDQDSVVEVEAPESDGDDVINALMDAIDRTDVDDACRALRSRIGEQAKVRRRPKRTF